MTTILLIRGAPWVELLLVLLLVLWEGPRRTTTSFGVDAFTTTATTTTTTIRPRHHYHHDDTSRDASSSSSSLTRLYGNSDNIRVAMDMTEMYGIHSPQAKLAWEAVEEFDGRDNSAAYEPRWDRMMSDQQRQQAYEELQFTLQVLQRDRPHSQSGPSRRFAHNPELMDDIATELQSIKLAPPSKKPPPKIPGLWDAQLKARAMSQQFGNDSVEAKLAWEEVEELASAGLDNAIGETSYQTCDVGQAAEACLALEELDRFLYFEDQYNGVVGDDLRRDDDDPMIDDYPTGGLGGGGGRYQDSGGSSNYVGGYHDNLNDNGGQYVNGNINNYIDEIDNGRNYQDWNHHYDDDGRGGGVGPSSSSGSGQSHFDERRSGGYTSYNEDPY